MSGNRTRGTSLFELLARAWRFDDAVIRGEFNQDESAVLFQLRSGKLAQVHTRDEESPKSRTRIEFDTGRTTIRKRNKPVPEARVLPCEATTAHPPVRFAAQGFLVIDPEGVLQQIDTNGHIMPWALPHGSHTPTCLCSSNDGKVVATATHDHVQIVRTSNSEVDGSWDMGRQIQCMSFSGTADALAVWGDDCLSIINLQSAEGCLARIEGVTDVTEICWASSARHLACATNSDYFWIVDLESSMPQKVEGYPEKVSTVRFSKAGNALVTSGAFRLAGWSSDDLPQDDKPGTPLSTGKTGFVVIKTLAEHPSRSLVAVGYANGLVTITSIGTAQEMMVHKEEGAQVESLSWSPSGEHLSIGFSSGTAAIVTFPDKLFK